MFLSMKNFTNNNTCVMNTHLKVLFKTERFQETDHGHCICIKHTQSQTVQHTKKDQFWKKNFIVQLTHFKVW